MNHFYTKYQKFILWFALILITFPAISIIMALFFPKATFFIYVLDLLTSPFLFKQTDVVNVIGNVAIVFFVYLLFYFFSSIFLLKKLFKTKKVYMLPVIVLVLIGIGINLQGYLSAKEQEVQVVQAKQSLGKFYIEAKDFKFTTDESNKLLLSYTVTLNNLPAEEKVYTLDIGLLKNEETLTAFAPSVKVEIKDSKLAAASFINEAAMNLGLSKISTSENSIIIINDITGLDKTQIWGLYLGLKDEYGYYYLLENNFAL